MTNEKTMTSRTSRSWLSSFGSIACLSLGASLPACGDTGSDLESGPSDLGAGGAPGTMQPGGGAGGTSTTLAPVDGVYKDHRGNTLCEIAKEDCNAFAPGGYEIISAPMARLNRYQYNRTVRDVLGSQLTPGDLFPVDETVHGFDTISALHGLQPTHVERYMAAARQLADEFMERPAGDPVRDRYITCDLASGAACHQSVLNNFASQLWRRPVADSELASFLTLFAKQPTPAQGLHTALRALLVSPGFMFRIELDPNPTVPTPHLITAHELAVRLSYAVGGTSPDAELRRDADSGALLQTEVLVSHLERLLAIEDQRDSWVNTFAAQWLNIEGVNEAEPDEATFPTYDDPLREAMIAETKAFMTDFLDNNRALPELFTAPFTYVNERLATHYGMPGVTGTEMRLVQTTGTQRIGLLTHGSFLKGTSHALETSPVLRGLFVLDRLLCQEPPAPPPGVPPLPPRDAGGSVRERLLAHQAQGAACAACHAVLDPIGLGLEKFDAIGSYRESDEFGPIDATAELPTESGEKVAFDGVAGLAPLLAKDSRTVPCAVEKLMMFSLRREISGSDGKMHHVLSRATEVNGSSLRAALESIVVSDAFRMRRPGSTP